MHPIGTKFFLGIAEYIHNIFIISLTPAVKSNRDRKKSNTTETHAKKLKKYPGVG